MTTELRAALSEAFEKETPSDDTPTPPEVQSLAPAEEAAEVPPNDETASNAARQEPQATPETGTPEVEKPHAASKKADVPPAPAKVDEQPAAGQHRIDRAPASWKKEAKGEWATLPLQAREEIHRREMEVQKVLNETAPIRQEAQQFREAVTPYIARIQSLGVTPHQAVGELLRADYLLATGTPAQKAMFIDKLLQDYGVDINELDWRLAMAESSSLMSRPCSSTSCCRTMALTSMSSTRPSRGASVVVNNRSNRSLILIKLRSLFSNS